MESSQSEITLRYADDADQLHAVEPLWNALQEHHSGLVPNLGGSAPKRGLADSWRRRRAKYERWLEDPETFFVIAEDGERPIAERGSTFDSVGLHRRHGKLDGVWRDVLVVERLLG
jgi:hypothetical protein